MFAAVSAVYLFTWYGTKDQTASQTVAFFAWLIRHILLAFNLRSERQPILQLGFAGNRLMLVWAALVALFLISISVIPGAQHLMKITTLSPAQWGLIIAAAFGGTFWIELRKLILFKRNA